MNLALVSGGSRGLGAALCAEYRHREWSVVEFSRGGAGLGGVPAGSDAAGAPVEHVTVDFREPLAARAAAGEALSRLTSRRFDEIVAVANAGVLEPVGPLDRLTPEGIADNLAVNITSQILFVREVVTAFADHACPKTVVTISSGAALHGYAGWTLYCAAKAALDSLVRALALEQAERPRPFVAVSINPGVMDTGMQASIRDLDAADFPSRQRFLDLHAAGELRSPAAVAAAIAATVEARPAAGSRITL